MRPRLSWRSWTSGWYGHALGGSLLAVVIVGAGLALEWRRYGPDGPRVRARLEADMRQAIAGHDGALRQLAQQVASSDPLRDSLTPGSGPSDAAFRALETVIEAAGAIDCAVTVYNAAGTAMAWYGQPAAVLIDGADRVPSTFAVAGPASLRLVHAAPIPAPTRGGARRLGIVMVERVLSTVRAQGGAREDFLLDGGLVPVTVSLPRSGPSAPTGWHAFVIAGLDGEPLLRAWFDPGAIDQARRHWRGGTMAAGAGVLALTLILLAARLWPHPWPRPQVGTGLAGRVTLVLAARAVLGAALPEAWRQPSIPAAAASAPLGELLLGSPVEVWLNGLLALVLAAIAAEVVEAGRVSARGRLRGAAAARWLGRLRPALHLVTGLIVGAALVGFDRLAALALARDAFDTLDLSWLPTDPPRALVTTGLLLTCAAVLLGAVAAFRLAAGVLEAPVRSWAGRVGVAGLWTAPAAVMVLAWPRVSPSPVLVILGTLLTAALAASLPRTLARLRRSPVPSRLLLWATGLVLAALVLYPALSGSVERGRRHAVETRFAIQAMDHPQELQRRLNEALRQIDEVPALRGPLEAVEGVVGGGMPSPEAAFAIWQQTVLAELRLTSSVELYSEDGRLISRFALNFPDDEPISQSWHGAACQWEVYGEAVPFGAEERRMLHAERALCDLTGQPRGGVVVHLMLDYGAIPFVAPPSPYAQALLVSGGDARGAPPESVPVSLVIYGWGRTPVFASRGRAWPLDDELFSRIYASRDPFWARLEEAGRAEQVYFVNDRSGIYAIGYPERSLFDHAVSLAELIVFAGLVLVALGCLVAGVWRLAMAGAAARATRRRRVRSSFSRRLFLAFVAASLLPVLVLALGIRNYVAARLRNDVEAGAARTVSVAQRFIQDWLAMAERGEFSPLALTDEVMVWISRVIDQDVNVFVGTQLVATSERDLFASGLLSTRVPERVYRALVLGRQASYVGEDEIGGVRYLTAAAPVRAGGVDAIITVPLALKQREIEREIHEFDRGVQLGAVVFIVLGAAVGYWLAQRIAEPVERLTRASRRIAAGELSARVSLRTGDELQRLVESFNTMAEELERQRAQLEHTHRLEAWAEMARQVAHDIKNPLTPIQLSAEHLQRVHRDHGAPLGAVLERCVETILTQVRLLRRISSDFASFASTPVVRPEPTDMRQLLEQVIGGYATGLGDRVRVRLEVEEPLPVLHVDRLLVGRALTNVVENALHAMPSGGELRVAAHVEGDELVVRVHDTGVGMEATDLARAFDPSFSTKVTGSGLGLPIARRNIELHGGSVSLASIPGRGTTVEFRLPTGPPRVTLPRHV